MVKVDCAPGGALTPLVRVVMPQLGESIVEATLVRWHVAPGATVARGQVIAEVETDKATNEIPAPEAGVVGEILIQEGTTVPVGTAAPALTSASVARRMVGAIVDSVASRRDSSVDGVEGRAEVTT